MDSITQMALGASLGELALGRKVGRKAMAWGALAGTIPDLDVIASPFITAAQALRLHRGPTHSLFFAFVAAPLLGLLVARIHRKRNDAHADWKGWAWLFFLGLWTHPLIDWLTVYGTQLFWPITDHPYGLGALFIIDPLYSVPILIALVRSWFTTDDRKRLRWNRAALIFSTLYACWGIGVKYHVEALAWDNLREQGLELQVDRVLAKATPLNTIAWDVLARGRDDVWESRYALTEDDTKFPFVAVPREWERTVPFQGSDAYDAIEWFSQGFSAARPAEGDTVARVLDLRFGKVVSNSDYSDSGYLFLYDFYQQDGVWTFGQKRPDADIGATFERLWLRIKGEEPAENDPRLDVSP